MSKRRAFKPRTTIVPRFLLRGVFAGVVPTIAACGPPTIITVAMVAFDADATASDSADAVATETDMGRPIGVAMMAFDGG
jgi:hypothetical protein